MYFLYGRIFIFILKSTFVNGFMRQPFIFISYLIFNMMIISRVIRYMLYINFPVKNPTLVLLYSLFVANSKLTQSELCYAKTSNSSLLCV